MAVKVKVIVPPELDDLLKRTKGIDTSLQKDKALKAFSPIFARELVLKSGGRGSFAKGWLLRLIGKGKLLIENTFGKAAFVEFPTKPHIIKPRRAEVLAWRRGGQGPFSAFSVKGSTKAGAFIFAGKVKHPGTKGKYAFPRALTEKAADLHKLLIDELNSIFKG